MRIAVQCQSLVPRHSGGIEHFSYGLIQGLSAAEPDWSIHVSIVGGSSGAWLGRLGGLENVFLHELASSAKFGAGGSRRTSYVRSAKRLLRQAPPVEAAVRSAVGLREREHLRRIKADVVYYPYHRSHQAGSPSVVTAHDLRVLQPDFYDRCDAKRLEANLRRAQKVTTSWTHPYRQLCDRFDWIAPKLIHIPIPPLVRADGPDASGASEEGLILYAASTAQHKNHVRLIEAVAALRLQRDVKLVCAGPHLEPGYGEALRAVRAHGLDEAVSFPGFVADDDLRDLYRRATLVVVPTLWEAASGTLLEALAFGKPVACSDIAPNRAVVEELGANVRFFDPLRSAEITSAIADILDEPRRFLLGSESAAAELSSRTWEDAARGYAAVFRAVAQGCRI